METKTNNVKRWQESDRHVFCHGCGEEIKAEDANWHTGEPYCNGCEKTESEADPELNII